MSFCRDTDRSISDDRGIGNVLITIGASMTASIDVPDNRCRVAADARGKIRTTSPVRSQINVDEIATVEKK